MGGKLYSMSNSVEFLKFPPLSLIGKFRLGATIGLCGSGKRLEAVGVDPRGRLAYNAFGQERFRKDVATAVAGQAG